MYLALYLSFSLLVCGSMFKTNWDCKMHKKKHYPAGGGFIKDIIPRSRRQHDINDVKCQYCGKTFKVHVRVRRPFRGVGAVLSSDIKASQELGGGVFHSNMNAHVLHERGAPFRLKFGLGVGVLPSDII